MSKREAFKSLGMMPRNVRWALSAQSADKSRIAISLWQDGFKPGPTGSMTYTLNNFGGWHRGAGVDLLFEHLAFAVANCGRVVHVVVAIRPGSCHERTTWFTRENLILRVTDLDPATGSFRLEQVSPSAALVA